jgi:hypothetical protein
MADEGDVESKLQQLLAKRGQDLARGLIDEITELHREIGQLRRELDALGDYQSMRDRWLSVGGQTSRAVRLPRLAIVEPSQPMRTSDGFYPLEHTGGGVAFRWTGPSAQFSFNVFVDRSRGADLKFETINCMDVELQKNLGLLVDGESVPIELSAADTAFTVTAALPAHDDGRSTNLVFVLPIVLTPTESTDTRLLGVAFKRLIVAARTESGIAPELAAAAQDPADA